jgi:hypothetical protein
MKRAVIALLSPVVLAGCLADGNERTVLGVEEPGRGVRLESVGDAGARPEAPVALDATAVPSLNRSAWQATTILVPVDGTFGHPTYAKPFLWTDATARQRGDPVTPLTALDLDGDTGRTQVWETLASPWRAIHDIGMMPIRMVHTRPWDEVRHIPRSYWRAPASVATTVSEPARGDEAGQ